MQEGFLQWKYDGVCCRETMLSRGMDRHGEYKQMYGTKWDRENHHQRDTEDLSREGRERASSAPPHCWAPLLGGRASSAPQTLLVLTMSTQ